MVLYQRGTALKPVVIDFGKSLKSPVDIKYKLTELQKKQYREHHRHIAPDLIDGVTAPSSLSDMYSFGRIFKSVIQYSSVNLSAFQPSILSMVRKCLKYHDTDRPTASETMMVLS